MSTKQETLHIKVILSQVNLGLPLKFNSVVAKNGDITYSIKEYKEKEKTITITNEEYKALEGNKDFFSKHQKMISTLERCNKISQAVFNKIDKLKGVVEKVENKVDTSVDNATHFEETEYTDEDLNEIESLQHGIVEDEDFDRAIKETLEPKKAPKKGIPVAEQIEKLLTDYKRNQLVKEVRKDYANSIKSFVEGNAEFIVKLNSELSTIKQAKEKLAKKTDSENNPQPLSKVGGHKTVQTVMKFD